MNTLLTVSETNALIGAGKKLHIAGDEGVLARLVPGGWIGGTIPYFLTANGGVVDREHLLVTELPREVLRTKARFVDADRLDDLQSGAFEHGFSIVIIPGMSPAHSKYATNVPDIAGFFDKPVVGWIAGVHLSDLATVKPKVFLGANGEVAHDRIVVMHAELPPDVEARIGIINLFERNERSDTIRFPETGFAVDECLINGRKASFFDYVKEKGLDQSLPLVANYSGEMINVSFQALDEASHKVLFYAPLVKDVEYCQAGAVGDYRAQLLSRIARRPVTPAFSCNCILNYLYAGLEGDQPLPIGGPATFGEIAYLLLNQTLVYLELARVDEKID